VALAESILENVPYGALLKRYYRAYPKAGYGGSFHHWALSAGDEPYYSFGNGSAMRVSPVGFVYSSLEDVLEQSRRSAEVTHNHPEGVKGAQFFKQKTAYEIIAGDWSSDVCSSDLPDAPLAAITQRFLASFGV